jgi:hypothetical protein
MRRGHTPAGDRLTPPDAPVAAAAGCSSLSAKAQRTLRYPMSRSRSSSHAADAIPPAARNRRVAAPRRAAPALARRGPRDRPANGPHPGSASHAFVTAACLLTACGASGAGPDQTLRQYLGAWSRSDGSAMRGLVAGQAPGFVAFNARAFASLGVSRARFTVRPMQAASASPMAAPGISATPTSPFRGIAYRGPRSSTRPQPQYARRATAPTKDEPRTSSSCREQQTAPPLLIGIDPHASGC